MLLAKKDEVRVLHLCSVCIVKRAETVFPVFSIARTRCTETLCALFLFYCHLPKLDVTGSIPVSRSIITSRWILSR